MIFYGTGAVWDSENKKVLCRFVDGSFETDDKRICGKLVALGYACDPEPIKDAADHIGESADMIESGKEVTRKDLLATAKIRGIKGADRMTKDALIEALKEAAK